MFNSSIGQARIMFADRFLNKFNMITALNKLLLNEKSYRKFNICNRSVIKRRRKYTIRKFLDVMNVLDD